MEVEVEVGLLCRDDLGEVLPAQLVAIFKLPVVFCLLLDCIVCQMDELIGNIIKRVLSTARSNVTVLVTVPFQVAIDACEHTKAPKVELAPMHEQRVVDILLDDEGAFSVFPHWTPNY